MLPKTFPEVVLVVVDVGCDDGLGGSPGSVHCILFWLLFLFIHHIYIITSLMHVVNMKGSKSRHLRYDDMII